MVRGPTQPVGGLSLADTRGQDIAVPGPSSSSGSSVAAVSRLEIERERLRREGFPAQVVETILAARRPSTVRIYDATWKIFRAWCTKSHVDPLSPSLPQILDFLQEGLSKGLSPNTLRRQVAALSSVVSIIQSEPLSHHPQVRAFLRGATNLHPPVIHRYPTWDLNKVLTALTKPPFEPLREASLQFLTFKVVFLVAITSARRISELAALSVRKDLCIFHGDRVVLRPDPSFLPKVNSAFHRAQELILPNFCPRPSREKERQWHTLDVRRALRVYIDRTRPFRKSEALFLSFQPKTLGSKVSPSTIGRWIRATISKAYSIQALPVPGGITAHSTRSAATTAAWATQASINDICRAATWTSPSPFIRHYKVDVFASAEASFGRRVLQQVANEPEGIPPQTESRP